MDPAPHHLPPPPRSPFDPRVTLERIGHLISRGILTVIYAVLVGPVGVFFRLFGDPLAVRGRAGSTWKPWRSRNDSLQRARAQD